ncbi:MAG: hypothetical protein EB140_15535 [Proteobacteria bacterium]|nr:hypothetical protein [Pseudomonadota bacterium]
MMAKLFITALERYPKPPRALRFPHLIQVWIIFLLTTVTTTESGVQYYQSVTFPMLYAAFVFKLKMEKF